MSDLLTSDGIDGWFDYHSLYDTAINGMQGGETIVEVGCWMGKSIVYLAQGLQSKGWQGRLVAVDNFKGDGDTGQPEGGFRAKFEANLEAAGVRGMVEIIEGDSADSAKNFGGESCDFVFIDAAHDFESVTEDVRAWLPKVKFGGVLAGHDFAAPSVANAVRQSLGAAAAFGPCWIWQKSSITLSILTPSLPSRADKLAKLQAEIARQIGDLPVEHLVLSDNRKMTVGEKRGALVQIARGEYVAFCDDDDWISSDYVSALLAGIKTRPDVVAFQQQASVNGEIATVDFDLEHGCNQPFIPGQTIKRVPWHVCAWRRSLVSPFHFPPTNYGEDWGWVSQFVGLAQTQAKIDRVLHYYQHDATTTEAPMPL